jgi:hypothetical protein
MGDRLTIFETDEGVTIAFGCRTYFIHRSEPFHNIAKICIEKDDYVPFYVEIARQEGVGEELRQELIKQVEILQGQGDK